jgi:hypothetical protein
MVWKREGCILAVLMCGCLGRRGFQTEVFFRLVGLESEA